MAKCIEIIRPDVAGSYQDGTVTLYADNIPTGNEWAVFLHEAGEHAGLNKMLGDDKYAQLNAQFERLLAAGDVDAVAAANRVPDDTPAQHVASERLAYLIEGVSNGYAKGRTLGLVRRVVAAVRAWLVAKAPAWVTRGVKITTDDIQALAVRAARSWADAEKTSSPSKSLRYDELYSKPDTHMNITQFKAYLKERYPSVAISLMSAANSIVINKIVVPEASRSTGLGTAVMNDITSWASNTGKILSLDPSADFGGKISRLKQFYKRFGFIENKGRNKDYEISESMYRPSNAAPPSEGLRRSTTAKFSRTSSSNQSRNSDDSVNRSSEDAGLWTDIDRAAPKEGLERGKELLNKSAEWVKNNASELGKRGFLPMLTLRQLVEVGAERAGITSAQGYMSAVEAMLKRRNKMQDESAQLAQRWMGLDKPIKHRLAWLMHAATKDGVDPSLDEFMPASVTVPGGVTRIDAELAEDFNAATKARRAAEADDTLNAVLATAENLQKLNQIKLRYQRKARKLATSRAKPDTFELAKQAAETAADEWRRVKNAKLSSDNRGKAFPKLSRLYRSLPANAQKVFTDARDMYELRFSETQAALEKSIEVSELQEGQKAGLMRRIRADFESARLAGVYFPLLRQGDYFVFGERERSFPAGKTQYRKNAGQIDEVLNKATGEVVFQVRGDGRRFGSLAAAQRDASTWATREDALASLNSRADLVGKDLVAIEVGEGWILEDNPVEQAFSMVGTSREAEQLKQEWQRDGLLNVRFGVKKDQQTKDDLVQVSAFAQLLTEMEANGQGVSDEVYQAYLAVLPDLSMRKSHIHRKGTAGYAEDALQAFSHSMMHQAHQISKLEYRDVLSKVLGDVSVQAFEAPQDQALLAGNVREALKARHDWVMSPSNARWTNWTSSFGFTMYLGLSPAAALVNLTQTAVLAYPMLAAEFGWGEAGKALSKAASQLNMRETLLGDDAIDRKVLSDGEITAFEDWHESGVIDKSMAHMLAGIGDSDSLQNSPAYQKYVGKTAHLFHKAEIVNREVTLLAGYRLAVKAGKSHAVAVKMAEDITWSSQFDYSNANRASFMQNDFAKLALMFKSYSQHMIYFMLKNAADWGKGGPEGKKAQARLLGMLGVTLAMGGVSALPVGVVGLATGAMYSQQRFGGKKTLAGLSALGGLMLMASAMWDDDEPFEWDAEVRAALREMGGDGLEALVFRGAVNAVTGVNVSSRISLDDLVWRGSDRELSAAGEKGVIYENLAGPVVGYGLNAMTTVRELWDRNHEWRAVEKLMPKFARDVMKTLRYGNEGALSMRGDQVLGSDLTGLPYSDDLTMWNLLWQAQGFGAEKLSRQYIKTNDLKNYENRLKHRRTQILTRYYQAYIERDQDGMQGAVDAAVRWNRANPRAKPINGKVLKSSLRTRLRYRGESVNGASVQKGFRYLLRDLHM